MSLQVLKNQLVEQFGISDNFIAASDHKYSCRCDICLQWWVQAGVEELGEGEYRAGPFTREEFEAAGGRWPQETIVNWLWEKYEVHYHNFVVSYQHLDKEPEGEEEVVLAEAWLRENRPGIWKEWEEKCQTQLSL